MATLGTLRDRLELMLSIPGGDAYVDSATELEDINEAYRKTAYTWDWPQLLIKRGARILSGQKKYPVPANFRKFRSMYVLGGQRDEVELDLVRFTPLSYGIDLETGEFILRDTPGSNGTEFTITNAESAGNAVTIEVNSVSGLSAGDEIVFPNDGNPEVTFINSVDSTNTTITARLDTSKSANAVFYRAVDNIMFNFYRTITALSISSDEPLLPADIHLSMIYYSAFLAYSRLEEHINAEKALVFWREQIEDYWRAFDKGSTGKVLSFGIK